MRVLQVIPYLHPSYGGPVTSLNVILSALHASGLKSDVLSTAAGFELGDFQKQNSNLDSGVNKHIFNLSFPKFWFYSSAMNNWLHKNITDYDLIHLHVPFTAPFFMASRLAIAKNIPMVATLHGLLDPWSMAHKKLKKGLYYQLIEKKCLSSCAALHVTSSLEELAVKNLMIPTPIQNIRWAVSFPYEESAKEIRHDLIRLLFIGRLHPVKSIPTIFDAIAHLKKSGIDVVLDLAGSGDPSSEQLLREKINQYQIHQQVVWHGYVNENQKKTLYKKADLFVLPSLHENFGLAAAEAMAAGLPVIVSDQVGLAPDVLEAGAGLVIRAGNYRSLADAIRIIHEGNLSSKMSLAAKKLVKNSYSTEIFADKLLDMYQSALK